jgi:hypothetical protein
MVVRLAPPLQFSDLGRHPLRFSLSLAISGGAAGTKEGSNAIHNHKKRSLTAYFCRIACWLLVVLLNRLLVLGMQRTFWSSIGKMSGRSSAICATASSQRGFGIPVDKHDKRCDVTDDSSEVFEFHDTSLIVPTSLGIYPPPVQRLMNSKLDIPLESPSSFKFSPMFMESNAFACLVDNVVISSIAFVAVRLLLCRAPATHFFQSLSYCV